MPGKLNFSADPEPRRKERLRLADLRSVRGKTHRDRHQHPVPGDVEELRPVSIPDGHLTASDGHLTLGTGGQRLHVDLPLTGFRGVERRPPAVR